MLILFLLFLNFGARAELKWIDSSLFDPEHSIYPHGTEAERTLPICLVETGEKPHIGKVVNEKCHYALPNTTGSKDSSWRPSYDFKSVDEFKVLISDSEEDYLWLEYEENAVEDLISNDEYHIFSVDNTGICKALNTSLVLFKGKFKRRGWHPGKVVFEDEDLFCYYEHGGSGDRSPNAYKIIEPNQVQLLLEKTIRRKL